MLDAGEAEFLHDLPSRFQWLCQIERRALDVEHGLAGVLAAVTVTSCFPRGPLGGQKLGRVVNGEVAIAFETKTTSALS